MHTEDELKDGTAQVAAHTVTEGTAEVIVDTQEAEGQATGNVIGTLEKRPMGSVGRLMSGNVVSMVATSEDIGLTEDKEQGRKVDGLL